jgi:hypothetical protein
MIKKKNKRHSIRETEEFKALAKELREQVPDKKKRLQEMLDEIIDAKPDNTKEWPQIFYNVSVPVRLSPREKTVGCPGLK